MSVVFERPRWKERRASRRVEAWVEGAGEMYGVVFWGA